MSKKQSAFKSIIWIMLPGFFFVIAVFAAAAFLLVSVPADATHTRASSNSAMSGLSTAERSGIDAQSKSVALTGQREENTVEQSSQRMRETLGIQKRKPAVNAVDVKLVRSSGCVVEGGSSERVAIMYRFDSPAIRATSMIELRQLIRDFKLCQNSAIQMISLPASVEGRSKDLTLRRLHELKYFFTRNSVPETALLYPVNI